MRFVLTVVTNTVNSAIFPQQPNTVWCRWHEEAEPTGPSEATKLNLKTDVVTLPPRGDDIRDTVGEATVQGRTQRLVHHESCAGKPPRSPSRSRRRASSGTV